MPSAHGGGRHTSRLWIGGAGWAPAVGVQAWRPEWWFSNATDMGLAAAAFSLALMGVRDGEFRVPGLVVGVVGLWWAVRALLSLTPRRNNTGLWLTRDSLVLESGEGRVTCPRAAVTAVGTRGDWGVVVGMREGVVWQRPPVGWRPRDQRLGEHHAAVSLAMTANDPHDVAGWLAGELGVEAPELSTL